MSILSNINKKTLISLLFLGGGAVLLGFNFSTSNIPFKTIFLDTYVSQLQQKTVVVLHSKLDSSASNVPVNEILASMSEYIDLKYNDPFPTSLENVKKSAIPFSIPIRTAECIRGSNSIYGLRVIDISSRGNQQLFTAVSQSRQYPSGLEIRVFKKSECTPLKSFVLIQYSLGWIKISELPLKLAAGRPGRLATLDKKSLIFSSAEGKIFKISEGKRVSRLKSNSQIFGKPYKKFNGGIKSILVKDNRLFVAWANGNPKCQKIQVYGALIETTSTLNFKNVFENHSCTLRKLNPSGSYISELAAIGGRLISFDKSSILLSIGTPNLWRGDEPVSPQPGLGRIVKVDINTNKVTTISTGHRNPQGMCIFDGKIYETEQGPQGGDEFNKITYSGNYGWPKNSLGRPYGAQVETQTIFNGSERFFGSHAFGVQPLYSWVPSIAVSPLLCPSSTSNSELNSSFWIGTLKDESIHRIRLSKSGGLLLDEKIDLGVRVREILAKDDKSGIWILTDSNQILDLSFI